MEDLQRNKGSVSSGSVTKTNISFTNTIETHAGRTSSGATKSIQKQDVIELDVDLDEIEEPEKFANAVGAKQVSGFMSFLSSLGDFIEEVAATAAVVVTSASSAVLKLGEKAVDGLVWVGSVAGSAVGLDTTGMKEFIARDLTGEANEWFYENTDIGRSINDASAIKYDSDLAKGIQNVTEKGLEIAAATALTVCTGGAAAPFVVGTIVGLGSTAESTYQTNGVETTFLQELGIAGGGVLTGLSWMANGKIGAGAINLWKDISEHGAKEVLLGLSKQVFNKDFITEQLRNTLSLRNARGRININAVINYVSSAMSTGEYIIPYITGEEQFDATAAFKIGRVYVTFLGINVIEDIARDYVSGYHTGGYMPKATEPDIVPLVTDQHDMEILDETPRTPDLADTAEIPIIKDTAAADEVAETGEKLQDVVGETTGYKKFSTYDEVVESLQDNRRIQEELDQATNERLGALLDQYQSNNPAEVGNYMMVNGYLRGDTFIVDETGAVTKVIIHSSSGAVKEYTPKEFKKLFGSANTKYIQLQETTEFLQKQIAQCPLGEDMQLIRGVNWDALAKYGITEGSSPEEIMIKLQEAGSYFEPGFMSCCPNIDEGLPSVLTNKPIKLILDVNGSTGAFDLSSRNKKELEILLDSGLSFDPVSVEEIDGSIFIHMRQN